MLGDQIVVVARLPRCITRRRIHIELVAFWRVRSVMDMPGLVGRVREALCKSGRACYLRESLSIVNIRSDIPITDLNLKYDPQNC
jgi:hypothetical protein